MDLTPEAAWFSDFVRVNDPLLPSLRHQLTRVIDRNIRMQKAEPRTPTKPRYHQKNTDLGSGGCRYARLNHLRMKRGFTEGPDTLLNMAVEEATLAKSFSTLEVVPLRGNGSRGSSYGNFGIQHAMSMRRTRVPSPDTRPATSIP